MDFVKAEANRRPMWCWRLQEAVVAARALTNIGKDEWSCNREAIATP